MVNHARLYAVVAATALFAHLNPVPALAGCDGLVPPPASSTSLKHPVSIPDLLALRDIGPSGIDGFDAHIFTLSPDGTRVAFQVRRADTATNSYCLGLFVVDLALPGRAKEIDQGGEVIPFETPAWGFAVGQLPGVARVITPKWSPDGRRIAYLRRDSGSTQAWIVDGALPARPLTHLAEGVDDVAWSGPHTLVVRVRSGLAAADREIDAEAASGWHFDERFMPLAGSRPLPRSPVTTTVWAVDALTGEARSATAEEAKALATDEGADGEGISQSANGEGGARAWTRSANPDDVTAQDRLFIRWPGRPETSCQAEVCRGITALWFSVDGQGLYIQRRARGAGINEVYRFKAGSAVPERVLSTQDRLINCMPVRQGALCADEGPLQPRRLVQIDMATGGMISVYDPNPEVAHWQTGQVRRLTWTNSYGLATFGDLVLPPGAKPGEKLPLIVVGYNDWGFLRGGTGDQYPILVYAAHGFAVLRYQTPIDIGFVKGARTWADMNRIAREDWQDFRSTTSAVEAGVQMVVDLGIADPKRVGLTGFSYGSSTAQFALVNSSLFAAAELESCCEEDDVTSHLVGPAMLSVLHDAGYPSLQEDGERFWKPMSFRLNAAKVTTPILMQLSDSEYVGALESYTALRDAHRPVDLFVFPGEHHVTFQPQHRSAKYVRSLDWFLYWLQDKRDSDPETAAMYEAWDRLRTHPAGTPLSP